MATRKLSKLKLKLLQEAVSSKAIRAKPMSNQFCAALEALDTQRLIKLDVGSYFIKWTLTAAGRDALNAALKAQA